MMHYFFSWHFYFMLNMSLALSYLIARSIVTYWLTHHTHAQQLQFMRFSLIITCMCFAAMPTIKLSMPMPDNTYKLQPYLDRTVEQFSKKHSLPHLNLNPYTEQTTRFSIERLVILILIISILIQTSQYALSNYKLQRLRSDSFIYRRLKHLELLISNKVSTPFCWVSFYRKRHFIISPYEMVTQRQYFRMSLRHELQHVRQGDLRWLQFLYFFKLTCSWNPFVKCWLNWMLEQQEFACDEAVILRKKTEPLLYAQCLLHAAKTMLQASLPSIHAPIAKMESSQLTRRITMLFNYKKKSTSLKLLSVYAAVFLSAGATAYALNANIGSLSTSEVQTIIQKAHINPAFASSTAPDVVTKLNEIRLNTQSREKMLGALTRMQHYRPYIQNQLAYENMPMELIAIPLVESGYEPLPAHRNPMQAAGIWQIIPSTAIRLGLTVDHQRDDRMDTVLATKAALHYLKSLYAQFGDWKLAALAYEIGEDHLEKLIAKTHTREPWKLVYSKKLPVKWQTELQNYLATLETTILLIHKPNLLKA